MTPSLGSFWALLVQDQARRPARVETLADGRQEYAQASVWTMQAIAARRPPAVVME